MVRIDGCDGYFVTPDGDVISFMDRRPLSSGRGSVSFISHTAQWLLSPTPDRHGYLKVGMIKNGRPIMRPVHQLVLEANGFNRPFDGAVVRHLDNNPANNKLDNLRWGTYLENSSDMVANGSFSGVKNTSSKLKESDIEYILTNIALPIIHFTEKYKVSEDTIIAVRGGRTYKKEVERILKSLNLKLSSPKKKKIKCVESGVEYASILEASIDIGLNSTAISDQLGGRLKKARGYTFNYIL